MKLNKSKVDTEKLASTKVKKPIPLKKKIAGVVGTAAVTGAGLLGTIDFSSTNNIQDIKNTENQVASITGEGNSQNNIQGSTEGNKATVDQLIAVKDNIQSASNEDFQQLVDKINARLANTKSNLQVLIDSNAESITSLESESKIPGDKGQDGSMVVLEGLLQEQESVIYVDVPLLKDVPLIGAAFRTKETSTVTSNLMIILRCTIISPITQEKSP